MESFDDKAQFGINVEEVESEESLLAFQNSISGGTEKLPIDPGEKLSKSLQSKKSISDKLISGDASRPADVSETSKEAEFLRELKAGDREVFDELIEVEADKVYQRAFDLTGSESSAREVVNEVFITLQALFSEDCLSEELLALDAPFSLNNLLHRLTYDFSLGRMFKNIGLSNTDLTCGTLDCGTEILIEDDANVADADLQEEE